MRCFTLLPAAVVGLSLSAKVALAAVAGVETFDAGVNGFEANTTSAVVVHAAAGGNPDGHLLSRKDLGPPVFDIGALTTGPNFTGDFAADGITGVSVDLNFLEGDFSGAWIRFRADAVTNGWRFPLTKAFPSDVWNTYAVNFDPTWTDAEAVLQGWVTDQQVDPAANPSPAFADVMSSVGYAEVRIASAPTSTLVGIDNFRLVPEPASVALGVVGSLLLVARIVRRKK